MKYLSFLFFITFLVINQSNQAQEVIALKELVASNLALHYQNNANRQLLYKEWSQKLPMQEINLINNVLQKNSGYKNLSSYSFNEDISYYGLCTSPDNKIFSAVDARLPEIYLYSLETGKLIGALKGHEQSVTAVQFYDNYTLISGSDDKKIIVWNLKKHEPLAIFNVNSEIKSLELSKDKHYLYAFLNNGSIEVWDLRTHELLHAIKAAFDVTDLFYLKRFNRQKDKIIFVEPDNRLLFVDLLTGRAYKSSSPHEFNIHDVIITSDDNYAISSSSDHFIMIWNLATGAHVKTVEGHSGAVTNLVSHGTTLVSGAADNTIKIWDITTGHCLHTLQESSQIINLKLFDNGKKLISGSFAGDIKVWDVDNGTPLQNIHAHSSMIHLVKLLDQKTILTVSLFDGMLRLWDISSGSCLYFKRITNQKNIISNRNQTNIHLSANKKNILVMDNALLSLIKPEQITMETMQNKPRNTNGLLSRLALLLPTGAVVLGAISLLSFAMNK